MTRLRKTTLAAVALFPLALAGTTGVSAQTLDTFSVLGATTVTNTGPTFLSGNIGVHPGEAITDDGVNGGLTVGGSTHAGGAVALGAQNELTAIINNPIPLIWGAEPPPTMTLGEELGGSTLASGVYDFEASAILNGILTLDGGGDPDALFIFLINDISTLTTFDGSSVELIGGARGSNVYWIVGSSATIGTDTRFAGRILARQNIALQTRATITCGAAWADEAAVTLDTNVINSVCAFSAFGDVVDDDSTAGEIADVIDDYVEGDGDLPDAFQDLLDVLDELTPEEAAALLGQLAGETATGVAPTGSQAMNSFLSLVLNSGSAPGGERVGPRVATVKALGYAGAGSPSPASSAVASFDSMSGRETLAPHVFDIWAATFGSQSDTDGSASAGTHDRSSTVFGVAGGFDVNVTPDTRVGIAFAGGTTDFGLSDDLGGGDSNMFQTAIYSRRDFDSAYVLAALAYGYHDVSTDRDVTWEIEEPPSTYDEHLSADFSAHNFAGQIEGGYRFGWVTPYGAVRLQAFYTPSYSESSDSLPDDGFALDYDSSTAINVRTEIGARMEHIFALADGASLALRSRIAWAHDFWSGEDGQATFQSLPGSDSFTIRGASPPSDSLLLSAGAEFGLGNGISFAGWFDGELAAGSEIYGGNVRVSYAW